MESEQETPQGGEGTDPVRRDPVGSAAVEEEAAGATLGDAVDRQEGSTIHAPWSELTVSALNAFQSSGWMHPFTCGGQHTVSPVLDAHPDGWHCPSEECDYTQGWAHVFMTNRKLWENRTLAGMLNRRHCTDLTPCGDASCRACYWRTKALEAGDKIRRESQLRQRVMKGVRLLRQWPGKVNPLDVAVWLLSLLTGGPGTHLQDVYGSGQEEPMRGVWTGKVNIHQEVMTLVVQVRGEEVPVDVLFHEEAKLLAAIATAHATRKGTEDDE